MAEFKIAVIPGDGIGPEIMEQGLAVLKKVSEKYGHTFHTTKLPAGGNAIDSMGECLPQSTVEECLKSDAVMLGAVGGPKWDNVPGNQRPERALLGLRSALGLFANLRPAIMHKALAEACPLKKEIVSGGMDILIVRELTGGIYFGERGMRQGRYGTEAYDVEAYSEMEIRRIAKIGFEAAQKRHGRLCCVDKANVLESSRLWRKILTEMAPDYPDVTLSFLYVDNAAMQLIHDPNQFDVIVTNNIFGDILSDEASIITGSIGMLPSASLSAGTLGMYEPIHGSAPDIAGKDLANPIATILSVAMMLRYSLGLTGEADAIEAAVTKVLEAGVRTVDIAAGAKSVGTCEMGRLICEAI